MARCAQFKIFKKELHLPSRFAKTGNLFWPDFPKFPSFVYHGGANWKDWSKELMVFGEWRFLVWREIQIRKIFLTVLGIKESLEWH